MVLVSEFEKCKDDLKYCYRKRINQRKSTRWPSELGDPTLYVDVTVVRAKILPQRFHEEHAMKVVKRDYSYITVDELLKDGYGKISLIEGDPGSGKTIFAFQICKNWAEDKLLKEDLVFWIPLRHYKSVTNTFELLDKLGYPEVMGYAQQYSGKHLVLMLDGWDELPNHLQKESLFHDIVFGPTREFSHSTIIVTSRPNCSSEIAKAVKETNSFYQILGFDQQMAVTYINTYFYNNPSSAKMLLDFLRSHKYLRQHFYIPISVTIMCFVYHSDGNQIPLTLCRLYERFVVLCLRSNIPDTCLQDLQKFKTIHDIPEKMRSLFDKLCKTAFDMLEDNKLVMHEEEFGVVQDDLDILQLKKFDGFGLLHIDHYTSKLATIETSYSFIHRTVQELLAAISLLDSGNISDILDDYFNEKSYLINMFPFLFSLASKEFLRPLAKKLIQIFNRSNVMLSCILYCLFEAHDETLCSEFGRVFSENRDITVTLEKFLDCHYACYFISVCGVKRLNINIQDFIFAAKTCDLQCEILHKYLQNSSSDIASFCFKRCITPICILSHKNTEQFAKVLSTQCNLLSMKLNLFIECVPGCVTKLCDSICKHNPQITELALPYGELSKNDLESIGSLFTMCLFIKRLYMQCSPSKGICLDLSQSFCKALCETKSLQILLLPGWTLSQADSKVFGNIISQNCSLKEVYLEVASADCLDPILNGLSSSTSITKFKASPSNTSISNTLGQCLKKCLTFNQSVNVIDLNLLVHKVVLSRVHILWSSTQVSSICTGLCANTSLVTLDITGCYIDTEACHDVCNMLSQNKTLQHLILNPVHLEKQEAVAMIDSCRTNDTFQLLSLVHWSPKLTSDDVTGKDSFQYSSDPEVMLILKQTQSHLKVYWLVSIINHLSFACRKSSQILCIWIYSMKVSYISYKAYEYNTIEQ